MERGGGRSAVIDFPVSTLRIHECRPYKTAPSCTYNIDGHTYIYIYARTPGCARLRPFACARALSSVFIFIELRVSAFLCDANILRLVSWEYGSPTSFRRKARHLVRATTAGHHSGLAPLQLIIKRVPR